MINCELFEKISTAWHDGNLSPELEKQVQDHVNICEHCQAMDIGDAWVKDQLGSLDQVEPSPDFEIRLQERIDSLSSSRTGRRRWDNSRRFPRSVAFGAGLATAVAVGVLRCIIPLKLSRQHRLASNLRYLLMQGVFITH